MLNGLPLHQLQTIMAQLVSPSIRTLVNEIPYTERSMNILMSWGTLTMAAPATRPQPTHLENVSLMHALSIQWWMKNFSQQVGENTRQINCSEVAVVLLLAALTTVPVVRSTRSNKCWLMFMYIIVRVACTIHIQMIIIQIKTQMNNPNHKIASLHIKKQLEIINKCTEIQGLSVGLIDDNLFNWRLTFLGPEGSLFEGGLYSVHFTFPQNFPNMPPKMIFKTEMFHPNIYPNGEVCISILHPPFEDPMNPQEKLEQKWNPILTIEAILISVISMMIDPNLDSPANVDAAKMFREKRQEYNKKVRRLAQKSLQG